MRYHEKLIHFAWWIKIFICQEAHRKRTLKMSLSFIHFTELRGIHGENPITFSDGLLESSCGLLLGLLPCPFLVILLEIAVWKTLSFKIQQQLLLSLCLGKGWLTDLGSTFAPCPRHTPLTSQTKLPWIHSGSELPCPGTSYICKGPTHPGTMP